MSYTNKRSNRYEDNIDNYKIFKNQKKPKNNEPWTDDIFPINYYYLLMENSKLFILMIIFLVLKILIFYIL